MTRPVDIQTKLDQSTNWEWEDRHVSQAYLNPGEIDKNASISIHDIVESGTVLIAAGPADLDLAGGGVGSENAGGYRIVPIGLIETAQISMNKPISRIFEIGSKLSYLIPGRTVGGISLSRVFFDGPSLLKALYFGEINKDFHDGTNKRAAFFSNRYFPKGVNIEEYQTFASIGSGNLAMNLASSFFDQPVGLAFFFKDQQKDTVGQIYFEGCRINTYNLGISANMNVLTEAVNMEFVRCRPIFTTASNNDAMPSALIDRNIVSPTETDESTPINDA